MPSRASVSRNRRQRHVFLAAARGQPFEHGLFHRYERVFSPTTMREIPSHDLPRAAVDHAHQVRPTHRRTRPDFRHVRLPDMIWLTGFHAAPLFLPAGSQPPRAHQQPTLAHHPQYLRLFSEDCAQGVLASVYNVKAKAWIAPSEPVDSIQQGKAKAEAYAKAYLKKSVNLELPSLEWKSSRSI
jgi:hypothetical protein